MDLTANMDDFEKVQELKALLVAAGRGEARSPDAEELYKDLRSELLQNPQVQPLLPTWLREYRGIREFWPFIKSQSPTYAGRQEFLRKEFEPALAHLEAVRMNREDSPEQFFPQGSDHDAFVEIRKIVAKASKEIQVVDPYVDDTLWALLTNIPQGTSVLVLTKSMKGDFLLEAKKFAKQHSCNVEIRTTQSFHDRFIVLDRAGCWHLGSSIKDAGTRAFLISEIQSPAVKTATIGAIDSEWDSSPVSPL